MTVNLRRWLIAILFFLGLFLTASIVFLYGEASAIDCPHCPIPTNLSSQSFLFLYGIASGFNPCLIALVSFIVAVTFQLGRGRGRAILRVCSMTAGVFYLYSIIFFIYERLPVITTLRIPLTVLLIFLGAIYIIEAMHDIRRVGWKKGEEPVTPIFKTPKCVKKFVEEASLKDNLYADFAIGAIFSLIKLPCVLPLFVLLYAQFKPLNFIANLLVFNLGVVFPIIIIGSFASLGIIKISQLSHLRFKSRFIQRLIIGIALLIAAAFINW